jgi:hypothetical protein
VLTIQWMELYVESYSISAVPIVVVIDFAMSSGDDSPVAPAECLDLETFAWLADTDCDPFHSQPPGLSDLVCRSVFKCVFAYKRMIPLKSDTSHLCKYLDREQS